MRGNGGHVVGLRTGDVILSVNGTEVRDHKQCVEFIEKRCRVGDCEVEIKPRTAVLAQGTALLRGLAATPLALRRVRRELDRGRVRSGPHSGSESEREDSPDGRASPMRADASRRSPSNSPSRRHDHGRERRAVVGPSPLTR